MPYERRSEDEDSRSWGGREGDRRHGTILYCSVRGAVPQSNQRAGTDRRTDPNADEWSSRLFVLGDVWLGPWAMPPWPMAMVHRWLDLDAKASSHLLAGLCPGRTCLRQPLLDTATLQLLLASRVAALLAISAVLAWFLLLLRACSLLSPAPASFRNRFHGGTAYACVGHLR